jgi:hypothetical protein
MVRAMEDAEEEEEVEGGGAHLTARRTKQGPKKGRRGGREILIDPPNIRGAYTQLNQVPGIYLASLFF